MENEIIENFYSEKLYKLFCSYIDSSFLFVEPGGNCGDYLIYLGAHKLATAAGIEYESVTHEQFMAGDYSSVDVVYIHGSGGFVPWWSGTPSIEFRHALSVHSGPIIIGPSTFAIDSEYLLENVINPLRKKEHKDVYFFCREMTSYLLLKGLLPIFVHLEIDHDTALNLEKSDFEPLPSCKNYVGYFIRNDKENDLPLSPFNSFLLDPGSYTSDFKQWLQLHSSANKIYTNRLHSSILGSILGKEVVLLPNSFHKNRSVWDYSLKERHVGWSEDLPINPFVLRMLKQSLVKKFLSSHKVNRLIKQVKYGV